MCCGSSQSPRVPASPDFRGPRMSVLVGETVQGRRVRCVDLGCNVVVTVIGVAMIIFAAVMLSTTAHQYGWIVKASAHYCTLGVVGVAGIVVTGLSIKWILEGCHKRNQFHEDVADVT